MASKPDMMLWLSDARGVYIPRDFAISFKDRAQSVAGVSDDTWAVLDAGPDHEQYWDAWQEVENDAVITDENGHKYRVYQNGDCWLVPEGMEWCESDETFVWPSEENDEE